MKAIILAGGKGTRLQPITHEIPKALMVGGGASLKGLKEEIRTKIEG